MYHCQCKAGRDQIGIGGRESLGIFSGVGVVLLQALKSRQGRQGTEGKDSFNTSSVNCGLQRKGSSEKVESGCSNKIIGKGEFLNQVQLMVGGKSR